MVRVGSRASSTYRKRRDISLTVSIECGGSTGQRLLQKMSPARLLHRSIDVAGINAFTLSKNFTSSWTSRKKFFNALVDKLVDSHGTWLPSGSQGEEKSTPP